MRPQRLSRACDAIVDFVAGENRSAIRAPRNVSNLSGCRWEVDDRPTAGRTDSQESSFGVRKPLAVRRNRSGRVAITHRAELLRGRDPRQSNRITIRSDTPAEDNGSRREQDECGEKRRSRCKRRHRQPNLLCVLCVRCALCDPGALVVPEILRLCSTAAMSFEPPSCARRRTRQRPRDSGRRRRCAIRRALRCTSLPCQAPSASRPSSVIPRR
jgi:hypothetical protein